MSHPLQELPGAISPGPTRGYFPNEHLRRGSFHAQHRQHRSPQLGPALAPTHPRTSPLPGHLCPCEQLRLLLGSQAC